MICQQLCNLENVMCVSVVWKKVYRSSCVLKRHMGVHRTVVGNADSANAVKNTEIFCQICLIRMKSDSVPKSHLRGRIVTKAMDSRGMGPAQISESGGSHHVRLNLKEFFMGITNLLQNSI